MGLINDIRQKIVCFYKRKMSINKYRTRTGYNRNHNTRKIKFQIQDTHNLYKRIILIKNKVVNKKRVYEALFFY